MSSVLNGYASPRAIGANTQCEWAASSAGTLTRPPKGAAPGERRKGATTAERESYTFHGISHREPLRALRARHTRHTQRRAHGPR